VFKGYWYGYDNGAWVGRDVRCGIGACPEDDNGWTVLATTVSAEACIDAEILQAYQEQHTTVEPGFRWIKNPAAISPVWLEKPEYKRTRSGRKFADFKAFLLELFQSALCVGLQGVHLILDNGSTHAPKQLGPWIASLALSFEVRIDWLPTHASWLDQVEIIFSKVQRAVLTPNDFPSTLALEKQLKTYFEDEINRHPKPMQWTYTKTKMLAKFGTSQPVELAA
jgi:hypothetical protein